MWELAKLEVPAYSRSEMPVKVFRRAAAMLRQASVACRSMPEMEEQADDVSVMASKYEHRDISSADEKYLYQRAYNARRGKAMYEDKISRSRKPRG